MTADKDSVGSALSASLYMKQTATPHLCPLFIYKARIPSVRDQIVTHHVNRQGPHATSRRRVFWPFLGAEAAAFLAGGMTYLAFFLPAMVRLGPLRVRALVLVR